jgi:hypothetical protein
LLSGIANESGFLGSIVSESVFAQDAKDAKARVSRAAAVSLNEWSLVFDAPLYIEQTDVIELKTNASYMSIHGPFHEAILSSSPPKRLSRSFLSHASLYREGLNSNSRRYQFLCFYKIIEGIRERRERLSGEARARGESVKVIPERVPSHSDQFVPWLNGIFPVRPAIWKPGELSTIFLPEAKGQKFYRISDDYLSPLRDAIAHSVLDRKELELSADDRIDLWKIAKWLPLTKCIVRRMLKREFPEEFLTHLADDGSSKMEGPSLSGISGAI